MNIPPQLDTPPQPITGWWQSLQRIYQQVAIVINGNLSLGQAASSSPGSAPGFGNFQKGNVSAVILGVVTPGVANTDFTITHNLGRPLTGYIPIRKGLYGDFIDGAGQPANTNINTYILRCSVASVSVIFYVF